MRRALGAAAALLALLAAPVAARAAPGPGLTGAADPAYALDLRWSPRGPGTLRGVERVTVSNRGTRPLRRVWLRTWANGPSDCHPRRITLRTVAGGTLGRRRCFAQAVDLDAPVDPGASAALVLALRVTARSNAGRFGRERRTALLGDVIPTLAVTDARGLHVDEPYVPGAESFYAQAGAWTARINLPAKLDLLGTGAEQSDVPDPDDPGRHVVTVATPHARSFALAIGPWRPRTRTVDGVTLRVAGPNAAHNRAILAELAHALPLFERRFGPYGSPELDAFNADFGMEYPEFVMTSASPSTPAHELAHQWWFGIVGDDQYASPWLDESFASYADDLAVPDRASCRGYNRPPAPGVRLDAGMDYFAAHPNRYVSVVYEFGRCRLHALEAQVGESAMTRFTRALVEAFRYRIVTDAGVARVLRQTMPARIDTDAFLRASALRTGRGA